MNSQKELFKEPSAQGPEATWIDVLFHEIPEEFIPILTRSKIVNAPKNSDVENQAAFDSDTGDLDAPHNFARLGREFEMLAPLLGHLPPLLRSILLRGDDGRVPVRHPHFCRFVPSSSKFYIFFTRRRYWFKIQHTVHVSWRHTSARQVAKHCGGLLSD